LHEQLIIQNNLNIINKTTNIRNIIIFNKPQIKANCQNEAISGKEDSYSKTSSPEFDKNNIEKLSNLNNNDILDSESQNTIKPNSLSIYDSNVSFKTLDQNSKIIKMKENSNSNKTSSKTYKNYSINKISEPKDDLKINLIDDKNENETIDNFGNINNKVSYHNNYNVKTQKSFINKNSELIVYNNRDSSEDDIFSKNNLARKYNATNNLLVENFCFCKNISINEDYKIDNTNFLNGANLDKEVTSCFSLEDASISKTKNVNIFEPNNNNLNFNKETSSKSIQNKDNVRRELFDLKGDPIDITNLHSNLKDKVLKENRYFFPNNSINNLDNKTNNEDVEKFEDLSIEPLELNNFNQNFQKELSNLLIENSNLFEKTQQNKLELSLPLNIIIDKNKKEELKFNFDNLKPLDKLYKESYLKQFMDSENNTCDKQNENCLFLGKKNPRSELEITKSNNELNTNIINNKDLFCENIRLTRNKIKHILNYNEYLKNSYNLDLGKINNKSNKRIKRTRNYDNNLKMKSL